MIINLKKAVELIKKGRVIAVPTETVFGLAADINCMKAINALFKLKDRPKNNPLTLQLFSEKDLDQFLSHKPHHLDQLISSFWPGALTLVLPIDEKKIPGQIRNGMPSCGFRITQCKATRDLIEQTNPLVITSANISGQKELSTADSIEEVFGKDFPVLEGSCSEFSGVASMVLAYIDASWVILRKGDASLKELRKILGYFPPVVDVQDYKTQKYSIRSQLFLKDKKYDGSIDTVLGFSDKEYPNAKEIVSLGELSKPDEIEKKLPQLLAKIHKESYPYIWVDMDFPKEGPLKKLAQTLNRVVSAGI